MKEKCNVGNDGPQLRELAGRVEMSAPAVGFAVERWEAIAHRNGHKLIE
ncbi:MAG: hypothetical protein ACFFCW_39810 [Candidatus Hodarchaeota archaeon]